MDVGLLIEILFKVMGGLGIFLLGMKNMSEGMQAVAGARLRRLIGAVTDNRVLAVLVGMSITCIIQSSSVTTVMVVGLVNSGFMSLMQAIGVIFGANIGTTITGWILTLKIGKYGLPLLGIAALFFLFSKNERVRYTGMAIMGIGMVFFGLELMSNGFKPLRSIPEFQTWFCRFQAETYPGVLKCAAVGCILTTIVQSSSATLGITMGLASTGIIGFHTAAALVLGENIGTTITAYLASLGAGTNAKRAAYAHIVFNIVGVLWITALFRFYIQLIEYLVLFAPETPVVENGVKTYPHMLAAIAMVHSGFNITNTILFLPFMGVLARLVTRMVPEKTIKEAHHLTYLDVRMLDSPALGIEQSKKEILFMAESVEKMLGCLRDEFSENQLDEAREQKIFHREEILDNVQREIALYLSELVSGRVPQDVTQEAQKQLRMADEYESLSDYIENVLKMFLKLHRKGLKLSEEGCAEILDLHDHVAAYIIEVSTAVREDVADVVIRAYSEGERINKVMKKYRKQHLNRLQAERVDPLASLIFMDMLNAYRRMKDHALNIAEAVARHDIE